MKDVNKMDTDIISWDQFGMEIAETAAKKSKDGSTKVGSCILNPKHRVVAVGYNGMPSRCYEPNMPWARDNEDQLENKYFYILHSEQNCLLNAVDTVVDGTIYVTLAPCSTCAKLLIQAGVTTVVYRDDLYPDLADSKAAMLLFKWARVTVRQFPVPVEVEENDEEAEVVEA